jgi:hypothetical protein
LPGPDLVDSAAIIEKESCFAFLLFLMFFKDCMGRNLKDTLQSLCKARDPGMFSSNTVLNRFENFLPRSGRPLPRKFNLRGRDSGAASREI